MYFDVIETVCNIPYTSMCVQIHRILISKLLGFILFCATLW